MIRMLLVVAILLGGCGSDDAEAPQEEGVFDDMTGTLDKAQDVERQVMEQKERMDKALAEAEQAEGAQDEEQP
ncbi:MAG TPA: hypothetical protein VFE85_00915 [Woeseiaceae bacterium]|nr:hypothetical protein [Woeseiaceae bacterium]